MTIKENLKKLNIEIAKPIAPVANYVGFNISGNQVFISGQLPIENSKMKYIGKVGKDISIEDAKKAAKLWVINIISQLNAALDEDLEKVGKCVKLGVFVNCQDDFTKHPEVANGASDLMVDIFEDKGRHSRFAVGVGSLPFGVSVEIDAIFEIK